jgi:hypothetical protein
MQFILFCCHDHLKYGIPDGEENIGCSSLGKCYVNLDKNEGLLRLAEAHECKIRRSRIVNMLPLA